MRRTAERGDSMSGIFGALGIAGVSLLATALTRRGMIPSIGGVMGSGDSGQGISVHKKIEINARPYPVEKVRGSPKKYTEYGHE